MEPVGIYKFAVYAYFSDFRGKAALPMIGNFMLQAATIHAEERGFGFADMKMQNRAWVLSRMVIEMNKYPSSGTNIIIKTWVHKVNRLFTERYFSIENENGQKMGFAKSLWASIDLDSRKASGLKNVKDLIKYINENKSCPIQDVKKIPTIEEEYEVVDNFIVKYSDMDVNQHLNSMKYIEHLVNIFDLKLFEEKEIRRMEINYLSEAKYGNRINILQKKEEESVYLIQMNCGENVICTSRIKWE